MKMKVLLSLILSIILLGSFAFSASARTDQFTVTNGGSSVPSLSDQKLGATGTNWSVRIDGVSFVGLPSGIFGDNVIYTRMRTSGGAYASNILAYSSSNYTNVYFVGYLTIYPGGPSIGQYGSSFKLYVSMPSGPSSAGTLGITWQA